MHAPRPFGLAVYGGQLTADDLAFIDSIAKRLTNIKTTGELTSLKLVYDLPDGGSVVVSDMGGIFRAVATKSVVPTKPIQADYMATADVPMLFSGIITKAVVRADEGVEIAITDWTKRRLRQYNPNFEATPRKRLTLHRFAIDYHKSVQEFAPNPPPPRRHTQYTKQRPTRYSGSMAKVIQIVGGYGRQDFDSLPNDYPNRLWEKAVITLPPDVAKKIKRELVDVMLPAYTGKPPKDGQYQYDYKHRHCHAVSFGADGSPWLLSISEKGVYAMPLPIIPATATKAYREWIESVGDSEILAILDEFGAMPSGESFPENEQDFRAWERAGVIIKVCDTADFYEHLAYSTAMGWSFNSLGTDGYNTCYNYNQKGLIVGYTYNMTLKLGSSFNNGTLSANKKTLDDHKAKELARYLSRLFQKIDSASAKGAAIRYKIRRLSDKELYERMNMSIDDWDNLTLDPIAKHTGQVRKVYEGILYHPAKFEFQPQIKFAEPLMNACLSFDFGVAEGYVKPKIPPKCDTVMLAYFADNDLKVVKYFYDQTQAQIQVDTNFEEYMTVGSWYQLVKNGASHISGYFYHSDIDDRQEVAPHTTYTTIKGEDKGYDTKPHFAFLEYWHMQGTIWRNRYYTHLTHSETYSDHNIDIALCVPYYMRDGVIYANQESKKDITEYESLKLNYVQDPTIYHYWTYDGVMHWRGGAYPPAKGSPYPQNASPVWVEDSSYNPHPSNTFADNGEWLDGGFPKDITWLVHPDSSTWHLSGGGSPPKVQEYAINSPTHDKITGYVSLSTSDNPKIVYNKVPEQRYFISSPDRYGSFFYKDACKNLMGDTVYANVSETIDGKRKYWGNSQFINGIGHDTAHHFIGVINE